MKKSQVVGLSVGVLLLGIIGLLGEIGIATGPAPSITFQNCKMQGDVDVNKVITLVAHSSTQDKATFKSLDDTYKIYFSPTSPFSDLVPPPPITVDTNTLTVATTFSVKASCFFSGHCDFPFTFKDTTHPEKNTPPPPAPNGICADPGVHITR